MNVFHRWYEELSSLSRDIVLQCFCADTPVPLEQLAQRHALDRETIRQRRSYLAYSFNRLLEDGSNLGNEIAQVELDLQKPCVISSLLHHHPWLGESVEDGLTVLRLFTGMRWHDATTDSTGRWIYGADLLECVDATVRALDLDSDEVISLSTVLRLLDAHEVPVPEDPDSMRAWLVHCGYECDGHQVSLSAPNREEPAAPVLEGSDDLPRLIQRLTELLQVNENPITSITLGDVMRAADEFDGELGEVSRRLRGAMFVGGGVWIVADRDTVCDGQRTAEAVSGPNLKLVTESPECADVGEGEATEPITGSAGFDLSTDLHGSNRREEADSCTPPEEPIHREAGAYESPVDRIAKLLEGRPEGMSSSLIKHALGAAVSQEQVIKALFGDDRFAITHQGAWYLSDFGAASSSAGTPEHPLFVIAGDVPGATPSSGGADGGPQAAVDGAGSRGASRRECDRLDKIESALREADQSLSIEELKERTGITLGYHYLKQQIEADPRFSRSQKNLWALTEWGMPMYKPIKELISDLVDAHGGVVAADEVVRVLCRDFEIKESSLRQSMSSPPFTARGGMVRRLGEYSAVQEAIPAARISEPEQSGQPDDEAPDVDDLMGRMGLI
ncbi:hypothetical protein ACFW6F_11335 [Streptomyces sp. NPDC058746]|uniref:hypothetical protein n=1 Tax=Streptomyces sp. NPDC058746 TaxID=3346622 RepID=UPI0036C84F6E